MSLTKFKAGPDAFSLLQTSWAADLNPIIEKVKAIGTLVSSINATSQTLVTNTVLNITSIVIPAGIWLCWGCVTWPTYPNNVTLITGSISLSPSTTGLDHDGSTIPASQTPNNGQVSVIVGPIPVKVQSPTRYYLNSKATFSGSAPTTQGSIYAMQIGIV